MNLDWYYTFLVLAKHLNYRKASEELFLTEPTLHQQIKKLERHLQVSLFEVVGKRLILTAVGREFVPLAERIIATYEEGIEAIRLRQQQKISHLELGVSPYIAIYILPKFLPHFFEQRPHITIGVSVMNQGIAKAVEDNQFDIGIDRVEPATRHLLSERICEGKIALFVPRVAKGMTEEEIFRTYKIIADNHPFYWEKLRQDIHCLVPQAEFLSIKDIRVTEKMIEMNQGVSYLPLYLKQECSPLLEVISPEKIETPVSFTYLMNRKENESIAQFKTLFKAFIEQEQEKMRMIDN